MTGSGSDSVQQSGPAGGRGDETGWHDFHRQMFDSNAPRSGWGQFVVMSTGVKMARSLASARDRARSAWIAEYGPEPERWPLPHPPLVLWIPDWASAGCVRCTWLDDRIPIFAAAAVSARSHAAHHVPPDTEWPALLHQPLKVWRRDRPDDTNAPEIAD